MIDDWRVQFQSTLAKDFIDKSGKVIPKGSEMFVSCACQWEKGVQIYFPMPSPIAMYLNMSKNNYTNSVNLKSKFKLIKGENSLTKSFSEITDYIEAYFGSIIFAITALESFCNLLIPDETIYKKQNKKFTSTYNKDQIERWVTLEDKLSIILPNIYGVTIDKSKKEWNDFKYIYQLRNRIIHTKDIDRTNSSVNDDSIWNQILKKKLINPYVCAKELMSQFYTDKNPKPDWINKSPI